MKAAIKDFLKNASREEWAKMSKQHTEDRCKMWAYEKTELGKRETEKTFELVSKMRNIMGKKESLTREDKELNVYINRLFMRYSMKMDRIKRRQEVAEEVAKYGYDFVRELERLKLMRLQLLQLVSIEVVNGTLPLEEVEEVMKR